MSVEIPKSRNVVWEGSAITLKEREERLKYKVHTFWFTGLSGSGKSTIAIALERLLFDSGYWITRLDGDNVRHGLSGDLGFSEEDRRENIRRIGHVSKLFFDAGCIVLCSFISPFREDRDFARDLYPEGRFHEIYLACELEELKKRDPKGLYKKALSGEIKNFTGINSPYEPPLKPELILHTDRETKEQTIDAVLNYILKALKPST